MWITILMVIDRWQEHNQEKDRGRIDHQVPSKLEEISAGWLMERAAAGRRGERRRARS